MYVYTSYLVYHTGIMPYLQHARTLIRTWYWYVNKYSKKNTMLLYQVLVVSSKKNRHPDFCLSCLTQSASMGNPAVYGTANSSWRFDGLATFYIKHGVRTSGMERELIPRTVLVHGGWFALLRVYNMYLSETRNTATEKRTEL